MINTVTRLSKKTVINFVVIFMLSPVIRAKRIMFFGCRICQMHMRNGSLLAAMSCSVWIC